MIIQLVYGLCYSWIYCRSGLYSLLVLDKGPHGLKVLVPINSIVKWTFCCSGEKNLESFSFNHFSFAFTFNHFPSSIFISQQTMVINLSWLLQQLEINTAEWLRKLFAFIFFSSNSFSSFPTAFLTKYSFATTFLTLIFCNSFSDKHKQALPRLKVWQSNFLPISRDMSNFFFHQKLLFAG